MRRFKANVLTAVELPDINTFAVVLAERSNGTGMRLELQKSLSFDEQDRRLGFDTYCLCTEGGTTHYGGVTSWALAPNSLELRLDSKAAEALDVDGGFVVDFAPENLSALAEGIKRILG